MARNFIPSDGPSGKRRFDRSHSAGRIASSTRRRVLTGLGVGGVAVLAGCAEDEPGDDNGDEEETDESESPIYSITSDTVDPSRVTYNPYHTTVQVGGQGTTWAYMAHAIGRRADGPLQDDGTVIHQDDLPELCEWEMVEPDRAQLTIRDEFSDLTWYPSGDPVTAEDIRAKLVLDRLADYRHQDQVDSYDVISDEQIDLQLQGPVNPDEFFHTLAPVNINVKYDMYEEWVEWAIESDYDQEVMDDVMEFQVREPYGHAPWIPVDTTADRVFFELNEDHPWVDQFNFSEFELVFTPQADVQWQRVVTSNTSAEVGRIPEAIVDQVPDQYRWYQAPTRNGMGIRIHWDVFDDLNARRAIGYILDAEVIAANSGLPKGISYIDWDWQTGIFQDEPGHRELIGDDIVDNLYWYEKDEDRATDLFEQANFEHDGDTLYWPGGDDPVELSVMAPTFLPTYIPRAETIADQLGDFGIEVSTTIQEPGGFLTSLATGDFEITTHWLGGFTYQPSANLTHLWAPGRIGAEMNDGAPLDDFEMPMPVGDPNGTLESVDLRSHLENLQSHLEEERLEAMRMLSWAQNRSLEYYVMTDGVDTFLLDEENWIGPEETDPASGVYSTTHAGQWLRTADLQARVDD